MSTNTPLMGIIPGELNTERGTLTEWQIRRILKAVAQDRIEAKQGLSYVPQQEVRAELTRTFGAGNWDTHAHDKELVYETNQPGTTEKTKDKMYWTVCYSVAVTLRIRSYTGLPIAEYTEYHAEENAPQPNRGEAHALALTSAVSYALRRAAIGIGDNMGLHLYDKGNLNPIILGTGQLTDPEGPYAKAIQARKAAADATRAAAPAAPAATPAPAAAPAPAAQQPQEPAEQPSAAPAPGDAPTPSEGDVGAALDALAAGFNHPEGRQG